MIRMLLVFAFSLFPWNFSSAITPTELKRLIDAQDVAAVSSALAERQSASIEGKLGNYDLSELYLVFRTTDPTVGAFIDNWLSVEPDSAPARAAALTKELHFADIYRGTDRSSSVGEKNWDRVRAHYAKARAHFYKLLPAALDHFPAVYAMFNSSMRYGDRKTARISGELYEELASERDLFWMGLHYALPNWGGSIDLMKRLCVLSRPKSISMEVCRAKIDVLIWNGISRERFAEIAEILRGDSVHLRHVSEALMVSGTAAAALEFLRERDAWRDWEQVARVTDATYVYPRGKDTSFLRYSLEKIVVIDPQNPRPLIALAGLLKEEDIDRAMELADRAMTLGNAMPDVLTTRLRIMDRHPVRRWDLGTEIDAVLIATNNSPDIVREIGEILLPPRYNKSDPPPGKTKEDGLLSCKRKKVIAGLALTCDRSPLFSSSCRRALGDDAIRLLESEMNDRMCLTEIPQSFRQEILSEFLKQEATHCRNINATSHEATGWIMGKDRDPSKLICIFYCRSNQFHLHETEERQCDMIVKRSKVETYFEVPRGSVFWKVLLKHK